ncbi:T9SS type A sorting domain-containing protein [candidate division WOR-3 bacterium]|uniref:T9SS type A sorting domain-containing protein n=1 Tax=candidate division WOR-3 bacterium TaxID=2052148 RepID=A0A9D5K792_UNCW3|nr:T9SS type A sorting domain-containing protein [candidate division WOR-3 bacterium]MBD3363633.1 T9SS type A sorting domain-containing protein [candidate division WOR-3 bacterium]
MHGFSSTDWNDNGVFDPEEDWYEEFPCDLYLADLDGDWSDDSIYAGEGPMTEGSDGIYDTHIGTREPEIWVSRIDASRITYRSQLEIYSDYFDRIHSYRIGEFVLPSKGLFYIDQDWHEGFTESEMYRLSDIYEEIRDTMITDTRDYTSRIRRDGLYLTVCVHSGPDAHYFHEVNEKYPDIMYNWELYYQQPQFGFYNLFACSNCRWVEPNSMGSIYSLLGNGLAVVGSAKTGSMLFFSNFNIPLSNGVSWGESFRLWTNNWLEYYGDSRSLRSWFMGMCLLGDGSLQVKGGAGIEEDSVDAVSPIMLETEVLSGTVRLTLPQSAKTVIEVYDASGRITATLCNEVLSEGQHSFSFDALAGVYFVRVSTPDELVVNKIVITD